mgnify:FL=1
MAKNFYAEDIFNSLKAYKRFKYLDPSFLEDLNTLFNCVPERLQGKLYNDILVYSISCANHKSLTTFCIPDDRMVPYKKPLDMTYKINLNCLNDYYKFY